MEELRDSEFATLEWVDWFTTDDFSNQSGIYRKPKLKRDTAVLDEAAMAA